ncbi:MAG: DUF1015 domain-containing protein [Fimbriimonadaceae bacterium]|nr:DUF1015 domain-containing protein [Fimbriimonadaceae bacterium]QYK56904.1 MAG: DUF1015 domain-containing protein [Fimbriimonadaceae bacterium]
MATIRPFRGLRYAETAGDLKDLVAPPYDVISESQREELARRSPYNVVHLTLPEQEEGDRSKFVKYARSAARLEDWRREGVLALEQEPGFYRYTQTFTVPGSGERLSRTKLIVLLKVEPYANGVVLPHEQTFPKHKEDRLRILEATRSHLECIFGLYEDDDNALHSLVTGAPARALADIVTDDDGIEHQLEIIDGPEETASIVTGLAAKRLWIADGHHRYETALAFREALGQRDGLVAEDFMMMAVCSMTDPGLVLLPTHRILKTMPIDAAELRKRMSEAFDVFDCPNDGLMTRIAEVQQGGQIAFGVALPGGQGFVAAASSADAIAGQIEGDASLSLKSLDVSILHGYIFAKLLGLTGMDFFGYTRDEKEAVGAVEEGSPASFLMNPPTVEDMRQIALGGEKMPQKSTYYYPKLLSGLAIWSLKDY